MDVGEKYTRAGSTSRTHRRVIAVKSSHAIRGGEFAWGIARLGQLCVSYTDGRDFFSNINTGEIDTRGRAPRGDKKYRRCFWEPRDNCNERLETARAHLRPSAAAAAGSLRKRHTLSPHPRVSLARCVCTARSRSFSLASCRAAVVPAAVCKHEIRTSP